VTAELSVKARCGLSRTWTRLIPAQFVKPFVKSNKNDFVDAEAIAEAVERKNMSLTRLRTSVTRNSVGSDFLDREVGHVIPVH
jgi:hypothetical protein